MGWLKHHDFSKHLFFLRSNTVVANQPSGSCRGANSKHHAAERCDLEFGFQTPLKNVKTHCKIFHKDFKFFSGAWAKIPNPTSLQRDVCYKMKLKNGNECSLDMLSISEIRSIQRPLISQRGLLHLQGTQLQPNHPQRAFSRYNEFPTIFLIVGFIRQVRERRQATLLFLASFSTVSWSFSSPSLSILPPNR